MAKRKKVRRFDPPLGVSQAAIEEEARHLAKEVDNHSAWSVNQIRESLQKSRRAWQQADATLRECLRHLPENDRLIVRRLLVRDLHQLLELYLAYATAKVAEAGVTPSLDGQETQAPAYSDWLYQEQTPGV